MSEAGVDNRANLPPISDELPEDTIKIMLATDNHIGYNERDPIRGQDAINTFKEILELARKHDVDFILLAGDLFHENRPSRDCLYRTIALLREYTLSDKPVQIELLSDPDEGKADGFSFPAINYEDPNFNVGTPVFSIHGNHDDPQGAGPEGALCALDLLSVAGVINYIGKSDLSASDDPNAGIQIKPVLLRKGATQLALYGVGNIKDQRMHFELRSNRVKMFMPKDKDDWFNILLVHQNRVKRGPLEAVPEGMFDDSINLVVWGHEHDCRIEPEPVAGKEYLITQPGSSVATSLADGEAIPKSACCIARDSAQNLSDDTHPSTNCSTFVIDDVNLSEAAETEGLDITNQIEVMKFLRGRVNALIDRAQEEWEERNADAGISPEQAGQMMLPLVRLKVETTGVSVMSNPVRFSQEFIGRVANPRDVLVFHRAKSMANRATKVVADEPELSIDDPNISAAEKLQKFVANSLKAYEKKLNNRGEIPEADLDDALGTNATLSAFQNQRREKEYQETQLGRAPKSKGKGRADDEDAAETRSVDSMEVDDDDMDGMGGGGGGVVKDDDDSDDVPAPKKASTSRAKKTPASKSAAKAAAKPAAKGRAKAPAKGKSKTLFVPDSDEDDAEVIDLPSEEEEEERKLLHRQSRKAELAF
ncbi:double-strand break repair protein MRE11 [Ceratobasidium sp. AG-Ba]|nr:double-strand break repair protein MRE11 [Ceratobasidium sp. AG-Ba]